MHHLQTQKIQSKDDKVISDKIKLLQQRHTDLAQQWHSFDLELLFERFDVLKSIVNYHLSMKQIAELRLS